MELDEMKSTWEQLGKRVEKQEILNHQVIEQMTRHSYNSSLRRISLPEFIGTIICYIAAAYISVNLLKIEFFAVQVLGAISILLLLIMPIISLQSVRVMKQVNISSLTYLETIRIFSKQKIKFHELQKINVVLGMLLMLIIIPVFAAIQGKNVNQMPYFWTIVFPAGILFFIGFSLWVLKYYNKALKQAEQSLKSFTD